MENLNKPFKYYDQIWPIILIHILVKETIVLELLLKSSHLENIGINGHIFTMVIHNY